MPGEGTAAGEAKQKSSKLSRARSRVQRGQTARAARHSGVAANAFFNAVKEGEDGGFDLVEIKRINGKVVHYKNEKDRNGQARLKGSLHLRGKLHYNPLVIAAAHPGSFGLVRDGELQAVLTTEDALRAKAAVGWKEKGNEYSNAYEFEVDEERKPMKLVRHKGGPAAKLEAIPEKNENENENENENNEKGVVLVQVRGKRQVTRTRRGKVRPIPPAGPVAKKGGGTRRWKSHAV